MWLFQILNNTYFVELLRTAVSEKQMNCHFNIKLVLLKTLLTIYPKNDKENIVIKVCEISTHANHALFWPTPPTPTFYGPTPKFQPTPPTPTFYGPALPTLPTPKFEPRTHAPTPPTHPCHPRDLADSANETLFVTGNKYA